MASVNVAFFSGVKFCSVWGGGFGGDICFNLSRVYSAVYQLYGGGVECQTLFSGGLFALFSDAVLAVF